MEPHLVTKELTVFWYGTKRLCSACWELTCSWHLHPHPFLCSPCLPLIQLASVPSPLQSAHLTKITQVMPSHGIRDEKEADEMRRKRNKYFFMIVRAKVNSKRYRALKWRVIQAWLLFRCERSWYVYTSMCFFLSTHICPFNSKSYISTHVN